MYGLIVFYGLMHDNLADRKPLAKFLSIKLYVVALCVNRSRSNADGPLRLGNRIVMFIFYQGFVFSVSHLTRSITVPLTFSRLLFQSMLLATRFPRSDQIHRVLDLSEY